jgi:hypothetical protein
VIYSNYPNLTARKIKMHYGGLCSAYDTLDKINFLSKNNKLDIGIKIA